MTVGPTVTVVGGGLAGLSAAFDVARAGQQVQVLEAADRLGGKIWSSPVGDRLVDAGADSFLARVPEGRQLCEDLGLGDELTSPIAPVPAYLHRNGRLHQLPADTMLGIPTDLAALANNELISPAGLQRATADLEMATTSLDGDISVGAYFRQRLGDEITERLIDPMIGGINASDIDRLSLRSASPQIYNAASKSRSIIEGLRAMRASVGPTLGSAAPNTRPAPVFHGLPGGIARIIDELASALEASNVAALQLSAPADSALVSSASDAGPVIIATPAPAAARLLAETAPTASRLLSEIEYSSVAQVTVELPLDAVDPVLDASGILFPRVDGMIITACTWFSTKWAHYQRPSRVLLRMTSGRFGDDRALQFDDETLAATLLGELQTVVAVNQAPTATRVHRWIDALPQYVPGHQDRIEAIDRAIAAEAPGVRLAGAAYRGIGIPATIHSGRVAARQVLQR